MSTVWIRTPAEPVERIAEITRSKKHELTITDPNETLAPSPINHVAPEMALEARSPQRSGSESAQRRSSACAMSSAVCGDRTALRRWQIYSTRIVAGISVAMNVAGDGTWP